MICAALSGDSKDEVLQPITPQECSRIAQDLQIRKVQVESVVHLLDEGNTVPFITRYRKERTGGLHEELIRQVQLRVQFLRQLHDRKQTILRTIANQGRLTDELVNAFVSADTTKRLEDLYLPYKPKKKSLAVAAREKGLEPLALAIWHSDPAAENLDEMMTGMINPEKGLATADDAQCRRRAYYCGNAPPISAGGSGASSAGCSGRRGRSCRPRATSRMRDRGNEFKNYFQFKETVRQIPPHRILALNRGEKEQALKVNFEVARADPRRRGVRRHLRGKLLAAPLRGRRVLAVDPGFRTGCKLAVLDETGNLLEDGVVYPHTPPAARRAEAKVRLEELVRKHQVQVIAIGNGTACRETEEVVSELIGDLDARRHGKPPEAAPAEAAAPPAPVEAPPPEVVAPPAPEARLRPPPVEPAEPAAAGRCGAAARARKRRSVCSSGSGRSPPAATEVIPTPSTDRRLLTPRAARKPRPARRPTSAGYRILCFLGLPDAPADLAYVIVNEAGASVYSASSVAREEFPDYDATLRGTISIGRRLQDPLSELVKIDPQNIGVGLYQHDVSPRQLRESLDIVVESCVNSVGVDLNTASVPLLRHVSGLNQLVARDLVEHRKTNGPFKSRDQLMQVNGIGETRFIQAAGFLKIGEGGDPLDGTWIHPESYGIARQILTDLGFTPEDLRNRTRLEELREKLRTVSADEIASRLQAGVPTVRDILDALARPGRDPREDLPPPIFKKGVLKLEDLQAGMELKGTVLNVVDFGAFIDIGLKDSGLVHISQMANRYVKSPYEVAAVGDVVNVWVLAVDKERHRVSLTMIKPGTERKQPEKRPQPPPRRPAARRAPSAAARRGPAAAGGRRPAARRAAARRDRDRGLVRGKARVRARPAAGRPAASGHQPAADAARHDAPSDGGAISPAAAPAHSRSSRPPRRLRRPRGRPPRRPRA